MPDCNQFTRRQLEPAGAGAGATTVGGTTGDGGGSAAGAGTGVGGDGNCPGSALAAVSATWQLGQAVSPFEYHVQQLRQTARLTD